MGLNANGGTRKLRGEKDSQTGTQLNTAGRERWSGTRRKRGCTQRSPGASTQHRRKSRLARKNSGAVCGASKGRRERRSAFQNGNRGDEQTKERYWTKGEWDESGEKGKTYKPKGRQCGCREPGGRDLGLHLGGPEKWLIINQWGAGRRTTTRLKRISAFKQRQKYERVGKTLEMG